MGDRYILNLIGPFGLTSVGGKKVIVGSRKSRALMAMLATGERGRRSRVWLQDHLWGNAELEKGQASLRREISNLRKSLAKQDADPILIATANEVELDLSLTEVDFLKVLRGETDRRAALGSEFLEGLDIPNEEGFEDWLRLCRSGLEEIREEAETTSFQSRSNGSGFHDGQSSFKTKLAILPFSHWTNDSRGEALVDSLVEETSHVLSRYATLQVVDPATSLAFRNKDQQGEFVQEARLRYFVTGNVRQDGNQLKVTVGLIDCSTSHKVWSSKFDGQVSDFFDLPEQIAVALAPEIDGTIDRNEQRTARAVPVKTLDAYSLYWQANAVFRDWTADSVLEAISLTDQVLRLEEKNAWAMSLGGFCRAILVTYQWSNNPEQDRAEAKKFANRAAELESNEPIVLGYVAGTLGLLGEDIATADALIKRALDLEYPTSGIFFWSGWINLIQRKFAAAGERFRTCIELNPNSSVRPFMLAGLSLSELAKARFEQAEDYAEEALALMPNQPITLAAAGATKLANGKEGEAAALARTFRKEGGVEALSPLFKNDGEKAIVERVLDQIAAGSPPDLSHLLEQRPI